MRYRRQSIVLLLLGAAALIPILYVEQQWREMKLHQRAVKIMEQYGGGVDYEPPEFGMMTSWLCNLFGAEWKYRTTAYVRGRVPDWFDIPNVDPDRQLAQLRNLRNLDELYVSENIDNNQFKRLLEFIDVKTLMLKKTQVSGPGLQHLKRLCNLRKLYLVDSHISDADLQYIRDIDSLDFLERLDLDHTDVTDEGLKYLKHLTTLKDLSFIGTQVTGTGFADLSKLVNLERISAVGTPFNDEGLRHLQQFPRLHVIYLQKTKITDAGLKHLQHMQSLESVDLSETQISDVGLSYLQNLSNLRSLIVRGTKVTKEGAMELRKVLPGARIAWGDKYDDLDRKGDIESAGQNRQGVADERAVRERASDPSRP